MRKLILIAIAVALCAAGGLARAQVDCTKLVDDLQVRCEQINRMNQICAGKTGAARTTCERENYQVPVKEDCSKVPAAAKAMCEAHNRAAEKAEACNGKMGAELEACKRDIARNPPLRR